MLSLAWCANNRLQHGWYQFEEGLWSFCAYVKLYYAYIHTYVPVMHRYACKWNGVWYWRTHVLHIKLTCFGTTRYICCRMLPNPYFPCKSIPSRVRIFLKYFPTIFIYVKYSISVKKNLENLIKDHIFRNKGLLLSLNFVKISMIKIIWYFQC